MVGGCSLAMVSLSPKLCLVSFATFPAAVLLSRHMGKRIKARQRAVQEALAATAAEAHSALLNVRTLRLFAAERLASERYDERVRAARDEAATAGLYAAAVESGVGLAMQSSLLSVLAVGGQQVLDGALSYGELSSFFMYTLFLGFNAGNIATAYAELRRAAGASERVLALIGRPPPLTGSGTLPDCRGEFAFENLRFAYPTRPAETILDGLSLRVRQGERVAVIGQSGSGKPTPPLPTTRPGQHQHMQKHDVRDVSRRLRPVGKSTLISLLTGLYEPAGGRDIAEIWPRLALHELAGGRVWDLD